MTAHDRILTHFQLDSAYAAALERATERFLAELHALGWRPALRVIETSSELDALPDRTVVLTCRNTAVQKTDEAWEFPNEVGQCLSEAIELPVLVLWQPEVDGNA
jgi:hypothetical protein